MIRIGTICTFCKSENESVLEWAQDNGLLFCDTCCKSFIPDPKYIWTVDEDGKEEVVEKEDIKKDDPEDFGFFFEEPVVDKVAQDGMGLNFFIRDDNIIDDDTF